MDDKLFYRMINKIHWFRYQLLLLRQVGFKRRAKAFSKKIVYEILEISDGHPRLRMLRGCVFVIFGKDENFLSEYREGKNISMISSPRGILITELNQLTPSGRQIHADLKAALRLHRTESR